VVAPEPAQLRTTDGGEEFDVDTGRNLDAQPVAFVRHRVRLPGTLFVHGFEHGDAELLEVVERVALAARELIDQVDGWHAAHGHALKDLFQEGVALSRPSRDAAGSRSAVACSGLM
jgi:hypothetical protein